MMGKRTKVPLAAHKGIDGLWRVRCQKTGMLIAKELLEEDAVLFAAAPLLLKAAELAVERLLNAAASETSFERSKFFQAWANDLQAAIRQAEGGRSCKVS